MDFFLCFIIGCMFAFFVALTAFIVTYGNATNEENRYINIAVVVMFIVGFLFGVFGQLYR